MGDTGVVGGGPVGEKGTGVLVREMTIADYDAVRALWAASDGVVVGEADDSREAIARYLAHNPGLSFVASVDGAIAGAVLCGSDARRGYLHHMAVSRSARRRGVGRALGERALAALAARGIPKAHLMVLGTNRDAQRFWRELGWVERTDLVLMSKGTR